MSLLGEDESKEIVGMTMRQLREKLVLFSSGKLTIKPQSTAQENSGRRKHSTKSEDRMDWFFTTVEHLR
jgi:hypothetical protein